MVARVKNIIAQEFPSAAMKLIGPTAGYHVDDPAEHAAILCLIVVRLHFELLHSVNDRRHDICAGSQFRVNHSIQ